MKDWTFEYRGGEVTATVQAETEEEARTIILRGCQESVTFKVSTFDWQPEMLELSEE